MEKSQTFNIFQNKPPKPGIKKQKNCNQRPEYQRADYPRQMEEWEEVCEGENFSMAFLHFFFG